MPAFCNTKPLNKHSLFFEGMAAIEIPKEYDLKKSEEKWQKYWEDEQIYKFREDDLASDVYSVDTPPPTVSGKMHIGHAFSFTQQDIIVRYQRMLGKNIFCPFGTDDNGLPTERLIEKMKKVKARTMDRAAFAKLCVETLEKELRPEYIKDWKKIGMSCDFNIIYTTINPHCQKISQKSFIDLYDMGREYRLEAPTIWCPECATAIAQVELEDKSISSFFNDIIFKAEKDDGTEEELVIATTRPELLPACVAVFYQPGDERYKHLEGKTAKVPLFNFEVPILEDERADPEKGTGLVMCCTFGDLTDIEWWKFHKLPTKIAIDHTGKMTEFAGKYAGNSIETARKMIIEDLKDARLLITQTPVTHSVNTHERCGTPIEFLMTKQWFIKYLDLKDKFLEIGNTFNWYPKHMKNRYDNWVKGLQWDWCISRQRYFGVPFPVWYCKKCDEVILADEKQLPVDPLKDKAPVEKCPKCGGIDFAPEKDILDTWATSSLTPRLAIELFKDKPIFSKLYPMSLRPQAHDIISFWLFNTVVKSELHFGIKPWNNVMISGWALDSHGKKMSKSKGNVIEPRDMIEKYSAECMRYWAASSKLGDDLWFAEKEFIAGKRLITKLWNASRFAIASLEDYDLTKPTQLELIDRWLMSKLNTLIKTSTQSFNEYEYAKVRLDVESFFWQTFCDNYLEIVKDRIYNPQNYTNDGKKSAQFALFCCLRAVIKMLAPIMPYVTEEIYHLKFADIECCKSIHISKWPESKDEYLDENAEKAGDIAVDIISAVRKHKSGKNVSLKTPIKIMTIECKEETKPLLRPLLNDLKAVTRAEKIEFGHGDIACNEEVKIGIMI